MNRVFRIMNKIKDLLCTMICKAISKIFPQRHWVVFERGTDARDNGYWMYRYIKDKHPERKIYYVIDKNSADYEKVKEDAVHLGSLMNYWVVASAEKQISTHYASGLPMYDRRIFRLCRLEKNYYFLQHGITKDDLPELYGRTAPMRLFICGAKPEYDYVNPKFGHPDAVVQYTGFARFDQLHDFSVKRQILVMPTWRSYIKNIDALMESEYYMRWQSLLKNRKLSSWLKDNDIDLIVYVHYEMQAYAHAFSTDSERVIIADFNHYDVQELLKESAVLITDYSSVFFDFAYMCKPVVYYQFDKEEFRCHHYKAGYFDYNEMGFGEVCEQEEAVIAQLIKIKENEFHTEKKYYSRMQDFFPLHDNRNCERIYELISRDRL